MDQHILSLRLDADIMEMLRIAAELDRKPGTRGSLNAWCTKALLGKLMVHPRYVEIYERAHPNETKEAVQ